MWLKLYTLHTAVIAEREAPAACAHYCRFAAAAKVQLYRADEVLNSVRLSRLPYNLYCVGGDVKHCSLTPRPSVCLCLVFQIGMP